MGAPANRRPQLQGQKTVGYDKVSATKDVPCQARNLTGERSQGTTDVRDPVASHHHSETQTDEGIRRNKCSFPISHRESQKTVHCRMKAMAAQMQDSISNGHQAKQLTQ